MIDKKERKSVCGTNQKDSENKEDFGKYGKSLPLPRRAEEGTQEGQNVITQKRALNSLCLRVRGRAGTEASTL